MSWPRGYRRNRTVRLMGIERADLMRLLSMVSERRIMSIRDMSRRIGVSDRTVRRWIAGIDLPSQCYLPAIREVLYDIASLLSYDEDSIPIERECEERALQSHAID